jgi:hypothetical protein
MCHQAEKTQEKLLGNNEIVTAIYPPKNITERKVA